MMQQHIVLITASCVFFFSFFRLHGSSSLLCLALLSRPCNVFPMRRFLGIFSRKFGRGGHPQYFGMFGNLRDFFYHKHGHKFNAHTDTLESEFVTFI